MSISIDHHHHEQEQHHHCPHIDQHQRDGEEFRLEQHPDRRCGEERQHEEQRRVHRVLRGDDLQR